MTEPSASLPPHLSFERARWADVDLAGIVRFSAFTRLVEHAEQEWMREAGVPYATAFADTRFWMPRRRLGIEYLSPARLDDPLAMATWVDRIGETSYTLATDVVDARDGAPRARAEMVIVCVDRTQFATRSLPDDVRAYLRAWSGEAAAVRAAIPARLAALRQSPRAPLTFP